MTNHFSFLRTIAGLVAVLALVSCGSVQADEPKAGKSKDLQAEVGEEIDLFDAVKQGKVETRFVAHNANRGNLLVRNLTKNPLNIRVPDAFGAVPVMKQFGGGMGGMGGMGGGGMGGGGMGGMGGGGMGQAMGGGMGGGGMGMGGGGMGGGMGMMRVPAEKLVKVGANTVCLEQGKPDPTPQMAYNIVPIDQVTGDDRVKDLCKMVARGELPTNVGQALAWHLANDLSWEKLASLDRVRSRYTGNIKYFNPQELNYAMKVYGEKFNSKPSKSEYDNYGSKSTGKVSASSSSSTVLTSSND